MKTVYKIIAILARAKYMKKIILGVDEVGRGPLAGPLVVAAVAIGEDFPTHIGKVKITDSKKVSPKNRTILNDFIIKNACDYAISVICPIIIDEINILNATKKAMLDAIEKIKIEVDEIIVDSVRLDDLKREYIHPNKADENYLAVSAASIVAKVYHDRLMEYLDSIYPEYGFKSNMGYGTKAHLEAIKSHGISIVHRKSFLKKYI